MSIDSSLVFIISLFSPNSSDDGKHDQALSSRIGVLNRLDLTLDHLGVKTREAVGDKRTESAIKRDEVVRKGLTDLVDKVGQGKSGR